MISKKKYVHYSGKDQEYINDYYLLDSTLIIILEFNEMLYWYYNHKIIKTRDLIHNNQIVPFQTDTKIFMYVKSYFADDVIYDLEGNIIKIVKNDFVLYEVSNDGRNVVWTNNKNYYKNIASANLDDFFNNLITIYKPNGSNLLIHSIDIIITIKDLNLHLVNLVTNQTLPIFFGDNIFKIKRNILVQKSTQINIHDIDEFNLLNCVDHCPKFVYYHSKLDVLVTSNMQTFILTNKYELEQVKLGENYISDQISNHIMEVILCNDLLTELPDEILNIEVYQAIIRIFSHNSYCIDK